MKTHILGIAFCLIILNGFSQIQIGNDIMGEGDFNFMGWDVAMSADGQTIVVGAPGNDINAYSSGQVKVLQYNGSDWVQVGSDILGNSSEDSLGRSVDITSDGMTVVIGTQLNFHAGSAEVYEFNGSDWVQKGNSVFGIDTNDEFGTSIAISDDGNRIAVGAPYTNTSEFDNGVLRVYDYDGSQWNLVFEHYGDEANDVFGMSLDMSSDGTHIICGAWINIDGTSKEGYAKVFEYANSSWSQIGQTIVGETAGIFSGASTSISDNGQIIAFGSWGNNENGTNSGEVEVFELVGNVWQQLGSDIQGSSGFERFGWATDLSSDGNILAVGAPQGNYVQIFRYDGSDWNMIGNTISNNVNLNDFGFSLGLSSEGNRVVVGIYNSDINGNISGLVQVYDVTDLLSVEAFNHPKFLAFPNPAKNTLTIKGIIKIKALEISDINGRLLKRNSDLNQHSDLNVDVSSLNSGIYFINIETENSQQTLKFIKN